MTKQVSIPKWRACGGGHWGSVCTGGRGAFSCRDVVAIDGDPLAPALARDGIDRARPPRGQPPGSKLDAHEAFILDLVAQTKDMTLAEIGEKLAASHGVRVCPSTVWHFFAKRGLTHKKRLAMHRSSSARTCSRGAGSGSKARQGSLRNG